jgi:hypothetical protein
MRIKFFKWYDWAISGVHYNILPYRKLEDGYRTILQNDNGWMFQSVYLIHNISELRVQPVFTVRQQQELILKIFRERNSL